MHGQLLTLVNDQNGRRRTSWTEVVTPGALPTFTTRVRFKLLIKEDLPTLGKPTIPAPDTVQLTHSHTLCRHRQRPADILSWLAAESASARSAAILTTGQVIVLALHSICKVWGAVEGRGRCTYSDGGFKLVIASVVFEQLQERIGAQTV